MKLALDALEYLQGIVDTERGPKAASALRTAIEQAEQEQNNQEPVAWASINKNGDITHTSNKRTGWARTPLYTTPPAAPVQDLPFGVGGGLVAIKTLLSRDPCVHAKTAIEMIDAILKEHPEAQPAPVQDLPPECETEAEKRAYAFGWWKAMEASRAQRQCEDDK